MGQLGEGKMTGKGLASFGRWGSSVEKKKKREKAGSRS